MELTWEGDPAQHWKHPIMVPMPRLMFEEQSSTLSCSAGAAFKGGHSSYTVSSPAGGISCEQLHAAFLRDAMASLGSEAVKGEQTKLSWLAVIYEARLYEVLRRNSYQNGGNGDAACGLSNVSRTSPCLLFMRHSQKIARRGSSGNASSLDGVVLNVLRSCSGGRCHSLNVSVDSILSNEALVAVSRKRDENSQFKHAKGKAPSILHHGHVLERDGIASRDKLAPENGSRMRGHCQARGCPKGRRLRGKMSAAEATYLWLADFSAQQRRFDVTKKMRPQQRIARLQGDDATAEAMYVLLQKLSPQERRVAIAEKLSQQQRLALEGWMRRQRCVRSSERFDAICNSFPHMGAHIARCAQAGYRAEIYVGDHLYAQSGSYISRASAVEALATLVRFRAYKRVVATDLFSTGIAVEPADIFAKSVAESARQVFGEVGDGSAGIFSWRTRLTFAQGLRLSTPCRKDVETALQDWRRLSLARGESLVIGPHLRSHYTPIAAAQQWAGARAAWLQVWLEHGRTQDELRGRLVRMDAAWKTVQLKATLKWQRAQVKAGEHLARLLQRLHPDIVDS